MCTAWTEGSASNFILTLNHASDRPVTVQYYTGCTGVGGNVMFTVSNVLAYRNP